MALLSESQIAEVRDRVRLEDLAREYNVTLHPSGSRLRGLCPFHAEKTPSFYVHLDMQFFKCFGCGTGGNVFTFVQKSESVTFPEAVELLARRAGVVLEHEADGERRSGIGRNEKQALFRCLEAACEYYHRLLLDDRRAAQARDYLRSRGISEESWRRFRLGFSTDEWEGLIRFFDARLGAQSGDRSGGAAAAAHGRRERALGIAEKAGLVRRNSAGRWGDYFRGRILFPIADTLKRVIGFGGRTLGDEQPKYLNTPKTVLFDKSQVLYGLWLARPAIERQGTITVCEGYTDVVLAHQAGLEHFVASLGTAFTAQNARQLRRLAPRVQLIFDGDAAGQGAAERSLDLLVAEDLDVRIYTIAGGQDPAEAVLSLGAAAFREAIERDSVGIFEFKWRRAAGGGDAVSAPDGGSSSVADTATAVESVLALLRRVPNAVTQQLYVKELAERVGVDEGSIFRRLRDGSSHGRMARAGGSTERGSTPTVDNPSLGETIIECLFREPERARNRWQELPAGLLDEFDLFREPAVEGLARAVDGELRASGITEEGDDEQPPSLDANRLLKSQAGRPDVVEALVRVLGRIDGERPETKAMSGALTPDANERWSRCMRDLQRYLLDRRRKELERRKARAREEGDVQELQAVRKAYLELLRSTRRRG